MILFSESHRHQPIDHGEAVVDADGGNVGVCVCARLLESGNGGVSARQPRHFLAVIVSSASWRVGEPFGVAGCNR